jgi:alpha-galactosidase
MEERIVLIGAGSAMFTRGLVADLIRRKQPCELRLVDTADEPLTVADKLSRKMVAAASAPVTVRASLDRRELLPGATSIICTVGVGGRRGWEQDVLVPRKHGIFQPVGDSVMPGGTSRALRMVPAMVAIAEDVVDLAPDALFLNYGNPMTPVCRAIRKATGAPVVGLCHGVFHVAGHLAGVLGVPLDQLRYTAVGLNHLTWFVEVRASGRDMIPRLREIAREKLAGDPAALDSPFSWELTELFGAFPAVLDRHVTEFFPHLFASENSYWGRTPGVDVFSVEETISWGDRIYDEMKETAFSPDPLSADALERIGGEHEQVMEIIDSIRTDAGRVYSVNLPNTGQVPNLPLDAVIECPAVADAGGIRAIAQPPLAPGIAGTLATRLQWVETTVEAALEGSTDKFVQALLLDGAVTSVASARALARDLLEAHKEHLPRFG